MEYAYAKLQGLNDESFYIQHLPTKLCRKAGKDKEESKTGIESIAISDSHGIALCHSLISYDEKLSSFFLIPFGGVYVDNKFYTGVENAGDVIDDFFSKPPKDIERHEDFKIKLNNYSKIHFPTDDTETPLVFYLILPKTGNTSFFKKDLDLNPAKLAASKNKMPDKLLSSKWTMDDREQLKKYLLIYGYGRWKQIQEASKLAGGKLREKTVSEIRGFTNAFIQCIVENLSVDQSDLRKYLLSILEEYPEDPYILVNANDWDANAIKHRAVPWAKRIQLLQRVRSLIKRFKQEQRKGRNKSSKEMQWDNLLNFLSSGAFYGQRPSVLWTKKHDVDLLRGTYKFGYANYPSMKNHPDYSFRELEKIPGYSEFPNADTITRRLKKLAQQIAKFEQKEDGLDFEEISEDELKGWETEEKKKFFKLVTDLGIPLNNEGKPNWLELREKAAKELGTGQNSKNITEIEKFVDKLRIRCKQMVEAPLSKPENDDLADLNITLEDAQKFNKNNEMLYFIRRAILGNKMSLLTSKIDDLKKETQELSEDKPGAVPPEYDCSVHDKNILLYVSENGLSSLEKILGSQEHEFDKINMTPDQISQRLEFIYEFFTSFMAQSNAKKRRSDKPIRDETRKKTKFTLSKDDEGNIVFPLQVNNSLTLLDCGVINTSPNYHSEHNLFPIGFASVRAYASMFEKGKRVQYTNEILEGPDGKPLYRVTSSEDPDNPIVRDSSTGCWVYICIKVNDLADVKKTKVTISGTERFGLLEPNICRILEHLENAEKCTKYKFKYRTIEGDPEVIE